MKNILTFLFYHLCTYSFGQNGNIHSTLISTKPYDTVYLKKDYKLIFSTTNELRILRLVGPDVDTLISTINIKASEKYVGWLRADFDDYFVLYSGYDESKPAIRLFKKEKGELVLNGFGLDIDTLNQMVYYIDLNNQRKLGLFDVNKRKIELFTPPSTPCLWWFECLVSKSLTEKNLTIEYMGWKNDRLKKVYVREPRL